MPMNSSSTSKDIPSLLPYLQRDQENPTAKGSITLLDQFVADKTDSAWIIDDSNPFASIVEAAFICDSGSLLKKVFLFIQRDRYVINDDDLWPANNLDIEKLWQKSFSVYDRGNNNCRMIVLSAQISRTGRLNLLSPLFYCKEKQVYFHPPCPKCGHPLQLCDDDAFLKTYGLQPYSTSLKRYLYCEPCSAQPPSDFYVYECDPADPPILKDRWALMNAFGLLRESSDPSCSFPCIRCSDHEECYGSDPVNRSRIVNFSFYPFYLMIFEACSLHSIEYLQLISGAQFSDVEQQLDPLFNVQRLKCLNRVRMDGLLEASFFPKQDDRYFLELLYLKLSFLGDVVHNILLCPEMLKPPGFALSIENIWLQLYAQISTLPFSGNFKARIIDIVKPLAASKHSPEFPLDNLLVHLGLLCFYSLIVNGKNDRSEVFLALIKKRDMSTDNLSFGGFFGEGADPVFKPENIFWNPDGVKVNPGWFPLWEKSLEIGFDLLKPGIQDDLQRSCEMFSESLEVVRSEVKTAFIGDIPAGMNKHIHSEQCENDDALYEVIIKIGDKWRNEAVHRASTEYQPLKGTVMVSPRGDSQIPTPEREDEFTETVILSSGSKGRQDAFPPVRDVHHFHETVNVTSKAWTDAKSEMTSDEGDRTVFIKLRSGEPAEGDSLAKTRVLARPQIEISGEGDSLAKTNVLLKPRVDILVGEDALSKTNVLLKPQIQQSEEDDSLAKTNILPPKGSKDKSSGWEK